MTVLYISSALGSIESGGGYISEKILSSIRELVGGNIIVVNVDKKPYINANYNFINSKSKLSKIINLFGPFSNGWSLTKTLKLLGIIKKNKINIVWVDSSMNGVICLILKLFYKNLNFIIFYHNNEREFYRELSKFNKIGYIFFIKAFISEYIIRNIANSQVFLTNKDRNSCSGNACKTNIVISPIFDCEKNIGFGENLIFIGTPNQFNLEAVDFIVKKISPNVNNKIKIFGISDKQYSKKYSNNVEFMGRVADLKEAYSLSSIVLAPVFSGAGIKIKIAEALAYRKVVITSHHAAIGYEDFINLGVVIVCETIDDYISAVLKYSEYIISDFQFEKISYFLSRENFKNKISLLVKNIDD